MISDKEMISSTTSINKKSKPKVLIEEEIKNINN